MPGMVIKFGRYGQFLACENYPECQTTREVTKKADGSEKDSATEEVEEVEPCELCGKDMALKRGRFGAFYGCTGYPECKNIRKIDKKSGETIKAPPPVELDEECPVDGAKLVKRTGRYGEFVSCSNYPKCKYVQRETTGIACPKAGCKGELVVKKTRRGKEFLRMFKLSEMRRGLLGQTDHGSRVRIAKHHLFWRRPRRKKALFRYCKNEDCDYKISVESPTNNPKTKSGN